MAMTMVTPDTGDHHDKGGGADSNDLYESNGSSRQEKDLLTRLVGNVVADDDADEECSPGKGAIEERSLRRGTIVE